ncbi:paraquat-inducible protein A [Neorhizobium galegae]|uniref:paraquat-inducible protein A n=1 Tax=Neorhizobium galegae TaxID=399 RepID=UPI000621F7A6|nr:paraquat-inducible protein A [Neorhizobium galegae]KAB1124360.1 paraquat-inducible protein A [Neorhizobium galegae]MCQ1809524.1 paraquat-inducible protein A [Neorhizobium galegae]CDZ57546.1 Putative paraquat-inducible protein A [Neorhizobium galegae bv. orientalis]
MNWLRPLLLALAAIFLALGLFLPIIRFERLYFFSETPSPLELVAVLFREGDLALSLVVGLFSIVFPIVKLAGLAVQLSGRAVGAGFFRRAMPHLSKWSMMDVMLVAIVVFAAKSSGLAVAVSQPGLWFYAASAVIAGLLPSLSRIGSGQN